MPDKKNHSPVSATHNLFVDDRGMLGERSTFTSALTIEGTKIDVKVTFVSNA